MAILHINSSARIEGSITRVVSEYLVELLDKPVISRDLGQQPLPPISAEDLVDVHGSNLSSRPSFSRALALSNQLIDELKAVDTLVIAAPIYNFGIPATLKHWVDAICRAGISFRYTDRGPEGLLSLKDAYIVTGSGGTPVGSDMDFASRYLEHICQFIGVEKVHHIDASGSKGSPEQIISSARQQIDALLSEAKPAPVFDLV
ncbi:MAG: NAD(P)H-dependent oxidoreductase [Porticoccaceae bacterium]